jgi:hypothetical protein
MPTELRAALDHLFMQVIYLLDRSENISPKETMEAIQNGKIIEFLNRKFPDLDLSLFLGNHKEEGQKLANLLADVACSYSSLKQHATSNGLLVILSCIRIAYQNNH